MVTSVPENGMGLRLLQGGTLGIGPRREGRAKATGFSVRKGLNLSFTERSQKLGEKEGGARGSNQGDLS